MKKIERVVTQTAMTVFISSVLVPIGIVSIVIITLGLPILVWKTVGDDLNKNEKDR